MLYEPWQSFVEADKENLKHVLVCYHRNRSMHMSRILAIYFLFLIQIMNTRRKSLCVEDAMQDGEQKEQFRMFRALDLALCIVGGRSFK